MATKISIDKIGDSLSDTFKNIAEAYPDILQSVGKDAQFLIRNRIQETGVDATGKKLPSYSTVEVPTFFYFRKATNQSGRDIIKQRNKEKRGLSYRDFKAANNGAASVENTNLTFTGDMWRGFQQTFAGIKGGEFVVTLSGKNKGSEDKIEWNSERYGDILRLSAEEEKFLSEAFDEALQEIIDKND
jgi:hypothetical protein